MLSLFLSASVLGDRLVVFAVLLGGGGGGGGVLLSGLIDGPHLHAVVGAGVLGVELGQLDAGTEDAGQTNQGDAGQDDEAQLNDDAHRHRILLHAVRRDGRDGLSGGLHVLGALRAVARGRGAVAVQWHLRGGGGGGVLRRAESLHVPLSGGGPHQEDVDQGGVEVHDDGVRVGPIYHWQSSQIWVLLSHTQYFQIYIYCTVIFLFPSQ